MSNRKLFRLFPSLFVLSLVNTSCAAKGAETWTENMTCGEVQFELKSKCTDSKSDTTLNACKPQTLAVTHKKKIRKVILPELNNRSARLIKEAGGDLNDLFVTRWV